MNIIAVDDEQFAMIDLERAIQKALPGSVPSCFSKPSEALSFAKENPIDIAFLDINMGGMDGLKLAKQLKEVNGYTNIIFVTGYPHYALDSYSIPASGYIVKPVSEKMILAALEHLRSPLVKDSKKLRVQCFGNFEVFADGKPLSFTRTKTKELFAYLVSRQGAQCANSEIVAVIWDEKNDSPSLQSQFRHLASDLIQTLNSVNAGDVILKKRGYMAIFPDRLSCDLYDFCDANAHVVNMYKGEFMAQYSWAEFTNGYLERKLL